MIDTIKTLLNKTNELEEKINNINTSNENNTNSSNFICFSKGLLNLSFLTSNKILIAKFETIQNNNLYFQNQIELNMPSSQEVKISLIINNIAIYRSTRKLQAGYNQLNIMKSYTPLSSEEVELYLEIKCSENSLATLISDTLFVWGLNNIANEISYQAIETNNNFILSYLENNTLYYSFIDKGETSLNSEDFAYYANAISYCFVYSKYLDKLYLFRVDLDGNLFYTDFYENYEKYICSNVTHVSCSASNDIVLISYIQDNYCYTVEMDNTEALSMFTKIQCYDFAICKSLAYYNEHNEKFYLILSDKNNSNYILESVGETTTEHNYLYAEYSIEISTYEAIS